MLPPVPEITCTPGFVADPEALFAVLRDEVPWTDQMRSRRTASMGVPYNYAGARYPVAPWHPAVRALADRVEALLGHPITNCLLNNYPSGEHTLGWHSDDVTILAEGTGIAIVSLGAERVLRLRTETDAGLHYVDCPLPPGSLLHMSGAMQAAWKHALRRAPGAGPRISLSFRQIVRWDAEPPPLKPRWGD